MLLLLLLLRLLGLRRPWRRQMLPLTMVLLVIAGYRSLASAARSRMPQLEVDE